MPGRGVPCREGWSAGTSELVEWKLVQGCCWRPGVCAWAVTCCHLGTCDWGFQAIPNMSQHLKHV